MPMLDLKSVFLLMSGVFGVCYSRGHMDALLHDALVKNKLLAN